MTAAGIMLAGFGHARIMPVKAIIKPRSPSAVPVVRDETNSLS
jgi:hypothetical protein